MPETPFPDEWTKQSDERHRDRPMAISAVYILVLALLLVSAIAYNPLDTLVGVAMTATGLPVYLWIHGRGRP